MPFYFWLLLICAVRVLSVGDRRMIPSVVLLGLLSSSVFLGPCILPRYLLYLIFGLPLIAFFLVAARPSAALHISPRMAFGRCDEAPALVDVEWDGR